VDSPPRVAFFTDTFNEINGVALTSRQLTEFARKREYPFLCIRGAEKSFKTHDYGTTHIELARGPFAFSLDKGLRHDPMLWRHEAHVSEMVREFKPDIIHVVSPGDVSEIGVYIAKKMKLPLAISWHTNLHEFGAMRLAKYVGWMGQRAKGAISQVCEDLILDAVIRFYKLGDVLYAPNEELLEMLRRLTGKPVFLMKRGIDTELFNSAKRTVQDGIPRLGYVGRTTPEKNVRFLRDLETGLHAAGVPPFRFLIVGDGGERDWLRANLEAADLSGILRGEQLAEAFANMDVFTFPSRTDTFGNVVLEAFASGTPAVVTDAGGPKFIVQEGVSGFVTGQDSEFIERTARLLRDSDLRAHMACAARKQALGESWEAVFDKVYDGYCAGILQRFTAS
jgi:glycosyltransferase involved in cell wall biosynthesis